MLMISNIEKILLIINYTQTIESVNKNKNLILNQIYKKKYINMNDNNLLKGNRLDNINISKLSPKNLIISKKRTKIIIIILSIPRSPKKNNNNQQLKNKNKVDRSEKHKKSRI